MGLETQGIPTGFTDFNILTGGLCTGDLILLASKDEPARTALALNIVAGAPLMAMPRIPTLYISLSADRTKLKNRILKLLARLELQSRCEIEPLRSRVLSGRI